MENFRFEVDTWIGQEFTAWEQGTEEHNGGYRTKKRRLQRLLLERDQSEDAFAQLLTANLKDAYRSEGMDGGRLFGEFETPGIIKWVALRLKDYIETGEEEEPGWLKRRFGGSGVDPASWQGRARRNWRGVEGETGADYRKNVFGFGTVPPRANTGRRTGAASLRAAALQKERRDGVDSEDFNRRLEEWRHVREVKHNEVRKLEILACEID